MDAAKHNPKTATLDDVLLLTCCPFCGNSDDGFSYSYVLRYQQTMGWDNEGIYTDAGEPETLRRGVVRCDSCNKKLASPA